MPKKETENEIIYNDEIENNDCFLIMPISDPSTYIPGHFKQICEYIFKPACIKAGLNPIRADDFNRSSLIHIDILKRLLNSKMAICDLSTLNPNVLFELGIRQAFDKPTVLVQEENTPSIFDIAPLKYFEYRNSLHYKEVLEDQEKLADFLIETNNSLNEGRIVNSIVKLLSISKPNINDVKDDSSNVAFDYIISEINQLKNEFRKGNNQYNEYIYSNDDILTSLEQLREMITNGIPIAIFNNNYNQLKNRIGNMNESIIKATLLQELEEIKRESDKFK
ncbi:MAG: hypothetical protein ACI4XC_03205 [Eubacterium sp.]